jgi:hypothetical protein
MTQAKFNAWIRARFNLWTKSDVDAAIKAEREAIEKLFEELSDNTEPHKDYEDYDDGWVDACYACKLAVTSRGEA